MAVQDHHVVETMRAVTQFCGQADELFTELHRHLDDSRSSKAIAEAHTRGWDKVARAMESGLREIARAIEASGRR